MTAQRDEGQAPKPMGLLMVGALGVVFGDIGTSPLYALKVAVEASATAAGGRCVRQSHQKR